MSCAVSYWGTSPIRKRAPLGPYRRPMPRVQGGSEGGGHFLMGEVPLYLKRVISILGDPAARPGPSDASERE